jgi:hypothetical protein
MIIFQHWGEEDGRIPQCSNIGYIEKVKSLNSNKISKVKSKEWEVKVSAIAILPAAEPMSQGEKEKFLAQAKNNVTSVEKASMRTCCVSNMMCSTKIKQIWAKHIILGTKLD